jgi:hypothetical protein
MLIMVICIRLRLRNNHAALAFWLPLSKGSPFQSNQNLRCIASSLTEIISIEDATKYLRGYFYKRYFLQ